VLRDVLVHGKSSDHVLQIAHTQNAYRLNREEEEEKREEIKI
jgi:hypothetical protein